MRRGLGCRPFSLEEKGQQPEHQARQAPNALRHHYEGGSNRFHKNNRPSDTTFSTFQFGLVRERLKGNSFEDFDFRNHLPILKSICISAFSSMGCPLAIIFFTPFQGNQGGQSRACDLRGWRKFFHGHILRHFSIFCFFPSFREAETQRPHYTRAPTHIIILFSPLSTAPVSSSTRPNPNRSPDSTRKPSHRIA